MDKKSINTGSLLCLSLKWTKEFEVTYFVVTIVFLKKKMPSTQKGSRKGSSTYIAGTSFPFFTDKFDTFYYCIISWERSWWDCLGPKKNSLNTQNLLTEDKKEVISSEKRVHLFKKNLYIIIRRISLKVNLDILTLDNLYCSKNLRNNYLFDLKLLPK